jgi:hypothetical protein
VFRHVKDIMAGRRAVTSRLANSTITIRHRHPPLVNPFRHIRTMVLVTSRLMVRR